MDGWMGGTPEIVLNFFVDTLSEMYMENRLVVPNGEGYCIYNFFN
jgi:hypothetical protein